MAPRVVAQSTSFTELLEQLKQEHEREVRSLQGQVQVLRDRARSGSAISLGGGTIDCNTGQVAGIDGQTSPLRTGASDRSLKSALRVAGSNRSLEGSSSNSVARRLNRAPVTPPSTAVKLAQVAKRPQALDSGTEENLRSAAGMGAVDSDVPPVSPAGSEEKEMELFPSEGEYSATLTKMASTERKRFAEDAQNTQITDKSGNVLLANKLNLVMESALFTRMLHPHREQISRLMRLAGRGGISHVARFVHTGVFDTSCALLIIVNSGLIGAATQIRAGDANDGGSSSRSSEGLFAANAAFSAWFLLELVLRILADGLCAFFWASPVAKMNCFDFVVVLVDVVWLVQTLAAPDIDEEQGTPALTALRMLRVLRIVRALRVLRVAVVFRELRLMILSILRSGLSLLWSMSLLAVIIYIFSIYFMEVVTEYRKDGGSNQVLVESFGSVQEAMLTLFKVVTGGIDWEVIVEPLIDIHPGNALVLCLFIFFNNFVFFNVVTGVFVETALSSVRADKEEAIQLGIIGDQFTLRQLKLIFSGADKDGDGTLTHDEFTDLLSDVRTHTLLTALGLEIYDAQMMFHLIDADHSGHIAVDEFLVACMRMKGSAKAVDLCMLLAEHNRMREGWATFSKLVLQNFRQQNKTEQGMLRMLRSMEAAVKHNGMAYGETALVREHC